MELLELKKGEMIRIEGPTRVRVVRGEVYAVGNVYKEGSTFPILKARRLVLKALSDCSIELLIGPGGFVERTDPSEEVIDLWDSEIDSIEYRGVILVLGSMDVGKTTLTTMLANKSLSRGLNVSVIDADIGQNDLGPPTTVSMSSVRTPITHLRQLKAEYSLFLQTTSVEYVWRKVVSGVKRLADYAVNRLGADVVVVNTDGWITGGAIEYKKSLVESVKPTKVFVIGKDEDTLKLYDAVSGSAPTVILPAPPNVRVRSKQDRKVYREMGYGRFLFPPKETTLSLDKVNIANIPLFQGVKLDSQFISLISSLLDRRRIEYASQTGNRVYAVLSTNDWLVRKIPGAYLYGLPLGWERGILASLEDEEGFLVSLAMIKRIYYHKRRIVVITSKNVESEFRRVRQIRIGFIRLNENYEEVEKVNQLLKYEVYEEPVQTAHA